MAQAGQAAAGSEMDFYTGAPLALFMPELRKGHKQGLEYALRTLEELGYAGVGVPDHVVSTGWAQAAHGGPHTPGTEVFGYGDPFTYMAYLAAMTSRMKIYVRALILPYRQPIATAHALATIDSLSGGRLIFCPAPGYDEIEFRSFGVPKKQRGSRTEEYLQIIKLLWENKAASFQGKYYSFENIGLLVQPTQKPRPPIWMGGHSHVAHERAIRLADGWTSNCFPYQEEDRARTSMSFETMAWEIEWGHEECRKLGREPLHYAVSTGPGVTVTERSGELEPVVPAPAEGTWFQAVGTAEELIRQFDTCRRITRCDSFVLGLGGRGGPEAYLDNARKFAERVMPAFE